jgi:hypothetical protein
MLNDTSRLIFSNGFGYRHQVNSEGANVQFTFQANFWFEKELVTNPFDHMLNLSGNMSKYIVLDKDRTNQNFDQDI